MAMLAEQIENRVQTPCQFQVAFRRSEWNQPKEMDRFTIENQLLGQCLVFLDDGRNEQDCVQN